VTHSEGPLQRPLAAPFRDCRDAPGASSHYDVAAATNFFVTGPRPPAPLLDFGTLIYILQAIPNLATVVAQGGQTTIIPTNQQSGGSRRPIQSGHRLTILILGPRHRDLSFPASGLLGIVI
jgi:hypothetical protein